ncbi:D-alanine--D-alanine ligase family protein [Okibacterium endophyticum]
MLEAIDRDRFDVVPVGITRDGSFVLEEDDPSRFTLGARALPSVEDNGTRVQWPEDAHSREMTVTDRDGRRSLGVIDVVFPILHGPYGEDGTVQGLLDLMGLPYVGSGVLASSVAMDKHFTKTVLQHAGMTVASWRTVTDREHAVDPSVARSAAAELGFPVFVKPARAGSSVGVSKVTSVDEVDAAMDTAFQHDDRVLIEAGASGRELEIGVLGGRPGDPPRASVAGEIVVKGRDFYDFDAKYLDAPGVDLVCPAPLEPGEYAEMERAALEAFDAIGAEGLARVDFFLTDDGLVVNEINTMPGFTPISMFPKCWIASGMTYRELITELLDVAHVTGAR